MVTATKSAPKKAAPKSSKPAPKSGAKKSAPKSSASSSPVLYPDVEVAVCVGDDAITSEKAMELLGWRELPDESQEEYLLKDNHGKKIQCTSNLINRQVYGGIVATLAQEILRGRWRMNGENLIIGKQGAILNGQHSLIALILAVQTYNEDPEAYQFWHSRGQEPVMEKLIAFGISQDDETVNTMDTCKPRSLSDVVFRSECFADTSTSVRKNLAKILDYAVKFLWMRTGAGVDAYAPKRTHSESMAFINNHPTLLQCCKLIAEENEEGKISRVISPGTAAGLMYLMATSSSTADEYHASEMPSEALITTEQLELAEEFWIAISGSNRVMDPLHKALGNMVEESGGGSNQEKVAILVKAWIAFATAGTINDKDLKLKYVTDEDGYRQLIECPVTGGIDVGVPSAKEDAEDISPEEIKRRMEQVKNEHFNATTDAAKGAKKSSKGTAKGAAKGSVPPKIEIKTFKDNEVLWVTDPDNPEIKWKGFYVDHQTEAGRVYVKIKVAPGYAGANKVHNINLDFISR